MIDAANYTRTSHILPPKGAHIEWISPTGEVVRGRWFGKLMWKVQGNKTYTDYTPHLWRLI